MMVGIGLNDKLKSSNRGINEGEAVNPRYAFVSPKRLMTYFYPLLPLYYTPKKYLKNGDS
jgi:hypothetical protein